MKELKMWSRKMVIQFDLHFEKKEATFFNEKFAVTAKS